MNYTFIKDPTDPEYVLSVCRLCELDDNIIERYYIYDPFDWSGIMSRINLHFENVHGIAV